MTNRDNRSRRDFLKSAGALSSAAYLRLLAPGAAVIVQAACTARDNASRFSVLGDDEAADFAAIAARIIPTTDTPGAREAGVIHFIDRAFGAEMNEQLELARQQLDQLNSDVNETHSSVRRFSDLDNEAQDALLNEYESTPLFNMLWAMTIFGFLAMSKYGGNRGNVGWEVVGFVGDHGPWQYPFGHYDAEVHGETNDGE